MPIVGDVRDVLSELIEQLESRARRSRTPRRCKAWWAQIKRVAQAATASSTTAASKLIKPQYVIEKLYEVTKRRRVHHLRRRPAPDVGGAVLQVRQAAALDQLRRPRHDGLRPAVRRWACRWRNPGRDGRLRHRRSVDPDVHPGALDLQAVPPADQDHQPEQPLHGHGAAVAGVLPRQPLLPSPTWTRCPTSCKLAEAYGHVGMRIEKPADVERRAARSVRKRKTDLVFLDFITDQTENVCPMVPGGKGLTEMILGSEDL